ncbi:outer membrane protein assembly factor BamC [Thiomicrorhabdus xiamenensis]|uniref:Outer membrane protein assembly factor BamC n=1 Tax=Thiomicrorhabdus xiamenensis TaxID=2739063 RepID=A0A7D4NQR2_9GAMM|nr:outer membrane protein assembly factor BamC [Thiomicrorhabdus xiamenensis]QKI89431.1 outer membrane protein assembly factor BamC [Thiomicrorhabdus xiamenensis]
MRFAKKTLVASTLVMTFGLSGCSTISNLFGSDESYRDGEAKTVKSLEIPPNLFDPGRKENQLAPALRQAENAIAQEQMKNDYIPTFKADGVSIKFNLSERWLELATIDSDQVWAGLQRFFSNQGFKIAEARKDIGILKTDYVSRKELAPTDRYESAISKLLNSWRPELADGAFDKYVARVETDMQNGVTRVYINHHEMVEPGERNDTLTSAAWQMRPYSPVLEAQELYQAMLFFGSTEEIALAQLKASVQQVETVDGEEFEGLRMKASIDASWDYLQSTIYRANWNIHKSNGETKRMEVDVPESVREETGFFDTLAFWKERSKTDLPERVKLTLTENDDQTSLLKVSALDGDTPLNAEQRRYVFESLGLLAK